MSNEQEKALIPGNFKLGKVLFTIALLNNQNEIRTCSERQACFQASNINKQTWLNDAS